MSPSAPPISRTPLLTAVFEESTKVQRVEVQRIELEPEVHAPLHVHPCPVVGLIVKGSIVFQIEGQSEQILKPGDAFFEPANVKIARFDTGDEATTFVAYYLMGAEDQKLIRVLK